MPTTAPRLPGNGSLVQVADGSYWGVTTGNGGGAIYRIKADLSDWQKVYSFENAPVTSGANPVGGLAAQGSSNVLWGTTSKGGSFGFGTIFKIDTQTGVFTAVAQFTGTSGAAKGSMPQGTLLYTLNGFYGTTSAGGAANLGTLFSVADQTGTVTTLAEFTGNGAINKGSAPYGTLVRDGNFYWGTTSGGGSAGFGTIFKFVGGGPVTTVVEFTGNGVTNKGAAPFSGLIAQSTGMLWGTTSAGGAGGHGTIYQLTASTGALTTITEFTGSGVGKNGALPYAPLFKENSSTLWGCTSAGGAKGLGTVFKVNAVSRAVTSIADFTGPGAGNPGANPTAGLMGSTVTGLFGTTSKGGANGNGTVFKITTATGALTTLTEFAPIDLDKPSGPLSSLVDDGSGWLWGTTFGSPSFNSGSVYKVNPVTKELVTVAQFSPLNGGASRSGGELVNDGAGSFWGTTFAGGAAGLGAIFKVNISSGTMTQVLDFTGNGTANKGSRPYAGMVDDGAGFLWGTTTLGGANDLGTIFKINKTTQELITLVEFTGTSGAKPGESPYGRLVNDGAGFLWGTTMKGGTSNRGTVFKIHAATGTLTTVGNMAAVSASYPYAELAADGAGYFWGTTTDGYIFKVNISTGAMSGVAQFNSSYSPLYGGLTSDGAGYLWGMAYSNPNNGLGAIYKVNTGSGEVQPMLHFSGALASYASGSRPMGKLMAHSDGCFYGTTAWGGPNDGGTVFRIPYRPEVVTSAATNVLSNQVVLNGTVNINGMSVGLMFLYGTAPDALNKVILAGSDSDHSPLNGISTVDPVAATLTGLTPGTTYFYRLRASSGPGNFDGDVQSFTTLAASHDARLSSLTTSQGFFTPAFDPATLDYTLQVAHSTNKLSLTAVASESNAALMFNGTPLSSGSEKSDIPLAVGSTVIVLTVTAEDGTTTNTYTLTALRPQPPGTLDPTFNATGKVISAADGGASADSNSHGNAMIVLKDGKILVAGDFSTHADQDYDFALLRYHPDGTPDTSFGLNGAAITPIGSGNESARAIALQSDGKILVAGSSFDGGSVSFALVRYLPDGALDATFGSAGVVTTAMGSGDSQAYGVAVMPDGRIAVGGTATNGANTDFAVACYLSDGSLDTSFGSGGKVLTDFNSTNDEARGLALQSNGQIILAGKSNTGPNSTVALARYTLSGSLDTTFGTGGKVKTSAGLNAMALSLCLQKDDKIVIAGSTHSGAGTKYDFLVCRYLSNGTLDGTGGNVTSFANQDDFGYALALESNGQLVVAGSSNNGGNNDIAVARYNLSNALDTSFDGDGKVTTAIGTGDEAASSVAIQTDGCILVAGSTQDGSQSKIVLVRYRTAPFPEAVLQPPAARGATSVTLSGWVNAHEDMGGDAARATFEVYSGANLLKRVDAQPEPARGGSDVPVSATVTGLTANTTYTLRLKVSNAVGTNYTATIPFTTGNTNANLSSLSVVDTGSALYPSFSPNTLDYTCSIPYRAKTERVLARAADPEATLKINGVDAIYGILDSIPIDTETVIVVTASDGETTKTYRLSMAHALPRPSDLDVSFNGTGKTSTSMAEGDSFGNAVVVQDDNKVVVAGSTSDGTRRYFALARYSRDGSLDSSFGAGGKVITPIGKSDAEAYGLALQSDGKIIAAGYALGANNNKDDIALTRYNTDGALDTTFGTVGIVMTNLGAGNDYGRCVSIQSDGKILVAGCYWNGSNYDGTLIRYKANGSLDTAFGTAGKVTAAISTGSDYIRAIALQSDGKIITTGYYETDSGTDVFVLRCNTNGSLDTGFNANGKITHVDGAINARGFAAGIQADGKIVISGDCVVAGKLAPLLVRFNASGVLDTSFGEGGIGGTSTVEIPVSFRSLAIQQDGKIVVVGNGFLGRYSTSGWWDKAFDQGPAMTSERVIHGEDPGPAVSLTSDDRPVVAGSEETSGRHDFAVGRYGNDRVNEPTLWIRCNGVTVLNRDQCDAGEAAIGGQKILTFLVQNVGTNSTSNLTAYFDTPAGPFAIYSQPQTSMLLPGEEATLRVKYAPTALGPQTGTLRLFSDHLVVTIHGTGVKPLAALALKTLAASQVQPNSAILNGSVDPKGTVPEMSFEFGLTASYGQISSATPQLADGNGVVAVQRKLTGLLPHTKYFYRLRAQSSRGVNSAAGLTFTTGNRPPVAGADACQLLPGAVVAIDVLTNDGDDDGDVVKLVSASAPPALGKVKVEGRKLVFSASPAFAGGTCNYVIDDGFGGSATGTVSLILGTGSVELSGKNVDYLGANYSVNVTAEGEWSATASQPWVTVSPLSADSNGIANVSVQPNTTKSTRTTTINIAGQNHFITQTGVPIPTLSAPDSIPQAYVSGAYALQIPSVGLPVTFAAARLPLGLKIDKTGLISGTPTQDGEYNVAITAGNAAGTCPPLNITIKVQALPETTVGSYQGYIERDADLNGGLGSRFELTVTKTGAYTGKIVSGVTATALKGTLNRNPGTPGRPTFILMLPRKGKSDLTLRGAIEPGDEEGSGGSLENGAGDRADFRMWRSTWNAKHKATDYAVLHTFSLNPDNTGASDSSPGGYGYGSFAVKDSTGALSITGKLADGSAFTTATFLGPKGQVLIYQSLYGNKGSLVGMLDLTKGDSPLQNLIEGAVDRLSWMKPASVPPAKDLLYAGGFYIELVPEGGAFIPPAKGAVLMELENTSGNSRLSFNHGQLATEGREFNLDFSLLNPSPAGLTNKATMPAAADNPNKVNLPSVGASTGLFNGDFTIKGDVPAMNRKAAFQGIIIHNPDTGYQGRGFYLLQSPPNGSGQTLSNTPKYSGRVLMDRLKPVAP